MTDNEKKTMLQYMTDETDEGLLSTYLTLAEQVVLEKAFPYGNYPEELPTKYDAIQVEIAAYMINKRGAEGETVHLENGISRHWEDGGVAPSLLRRIVPYVGVLVTTSEEESEDETNEEES